MNRLRYNSKVGQRNHIGFVGLVLGLSWSQFTYTSDRTAASNQAASRIRNKIEDELTEDIGILEENHPQLLKELREVVCADETEANE